MLAQLNLAIWAWIESIRDLRRIHIWGPFLLVGAIQIAALLLLTQFHRPIVAPLLIPLIERFGGPMSLHYPQFFLFLPAAFSQVNLLIDWVVGSFAFGAAYLIILHLALGMRDRESWKVALRGYPGLLLLRLPLLVILVVVAWGVPTWLSPAGEVLVGNQARLVRYGSFFLGVVAEMLFVYAPLVFLVESRSPISAIKSGMSLFFHVPIATGLAVLIPNLSQVPVSWVLRRSDVIVRNLAPELVTLLLVGAILIYVMMNYFIVAAAVRIYGARGSNHEGAVPWSG